MKFEWPLKDNVVVTDQLRKHCEQKIQLKHELKCGYSHVHSIHANRIEHIHKFRSLKVLFLD